MISFHILLDKIRLEEIGKSGQVPKNIFQMSDWELQNTKVYLRLNV